MNIYLYNWSFNLPDILSFLATKTGLGCSTCIYSIKSQLNSVIFQLEGIHRHEMIY